MEPVPVEPVQSVESVSETFELMLLTVALTVVVPSKATTLSPTTNGAVFSVVTVVEVEVSPTT
jgi:hypothetical protein